MERKRKRKLAQTLITNSLSPICLFDIPFLCRLDLQRQDHTNLDSKANLKRKKKNKLDSPFDPCTSHFPYLPSSPPTFILFIPIKNYRNPLISWPVFLEQSKHRKEMLLGRIFRWTNHQSIYLEFEFKATHFKMHIYHLFHIWYVSHWIDEHTILSTSLSFVIDLIQSLGVQVLHHRLVHLS